jgi:hypothetical protein
MAAPAAIRFQRVTIVLSPFILMVRPNAPALCGTANCCVVLSGPPPATIVG